MVMCEFGECFVLRLSGVCLFVTQKKEVRSRSGCGTVKRNCKNENELVKFVSRFRATNYAQNRKKTKFSEMCLLRCLNVNVYICISFSSIRSFELHSLQYDNNAQVVSKRSFLS